MFPTRYYYINNNLICFTPIPHKKHHGTLPYMVKKWVESTPMFSHSSPYLYMLHQGLALACIIHSLVGSSKFRQVFMHMIYMFPHIKFVCSFVFSSTFWFTNYFCPGRHTERMCDSWIWHGPGPLEFMMRSCGWQKCVNIQKWPKWARY